MRMRNNPVTRILYFHMVLFIITTKLGFHGSEQG